MQKECLRFLKLLQKSPFKTADESLNSYNVATFCNYNFNKLSADLCYENLSLYTNDYKDEVSSPQSAADTSYIVPMSLVSCSCNKWGSWIWPPTKTLLLCFLQADWYLICVISGLWAERQQACCEISRQDSSRHGHFQNCPQVWRHARWECWVSVCWRHTQRCYLRINTENRETYLPDSAKLHIATNSWQTAFFHASFSRVVGLQTHSEKTQTESCCAEKQLQHTTPNQPEKLSLHVCYCVVQTNVTHWD